MNTAVRPDVAYLPSDLPSGSGPRPVSAVSWSAIAAGAAGAAALSLVLLVLGTGLGLASVSPWSNAGVGASAFGLGTILWMLAMQIAASGVGGFMAGRLRSRWPDAHADEVYFRDTAHGFLAWALASLAMASLLASVVSSLIGGGVAAGSAAAGAVVSAGGRGLIAAGDAAAANADDLASALFRSTDRAPAAAAPAGTAAPALSSVPPEVAAMVTRALRSGEWPAADRAEVVAVIARQTGLTPEQADQRLTEVVDRAKAALQVAETRTRAAADTARKATATASLWLFVSLMLGAFVSSVAAIYGGRLRDR
ncbi:hypothetical protein [Nevskia sp.]|uniref:hypothetical protein n=1 Tax=Nevskia sp. TaxID=1929292 RepID=UPI0025E163B2|nr:hypothetical protein [Nevskia sp.]